MCALGAPELTMKVQAGLKAKVPQPYRWVALKETRTRIKLKHCVWEDRESRCPATCPTHPSLTGCPPSRGGGEGPELLRRPLDVLTERDAGSDHGKKPPPLPAQPDVIQCRPEGAGSAPRAPKPPPPLTSLLFFLKAHSVFFRSLAGHGICSGGREGKDVRSSALL